MTFIEFVVKIATLLCCISVTGFLLVDLVNQERSRRRSQENNDE